MIGGSSVPAQHPKNYLNLDVFYVAEEKSIRIFCVVKIVGKVVIQVFLTTESTQMTGRLKGL